MSGERPAGMPGERPGVSGERPGMSGERPGYVKGAAWVCQGRGRRAADPPTVRHGRGLARGGQLPLKSDEGQNPAPGASQAVVMDHY